MPIRVQRARRRAVPRGGGGGEEDGRRTGFTSGDVTSERRHHRHILGELIHANQEMPTQRRASLSSIAYGQDDKFLVLALSPSHCRHSKYTSPLYLFIRSYPYSV